MLIQSNNDDLDLLAGQGEPEPDPTGIQQGDPQVAVAAPVTEPAVATPDPANFISRVANALGESVIDETLVLSRIEEMRNSQSAQPKFASELAEKVNDLLSQGATPEDVAVFMKHQTTDFAAMDPNVLIHEYLSERHPDLSSEDISGYMAEIGITGDSVTSKVKMQELRKEALSHFESKKVAVATPTSVAAAQQARQELEQLASQWEAAISKAVVDPFVSTISGVNVELALPKEHADQAREIAKQTLVANRLPVNDQNMSEALKMSQLLVVAQNLGAYVEKAVSTAVAEKRKQQVQAQSTTTPPAAPAVKSTLPTGHWTIKK